MANIPLAHILVKQDCVKVGQMGLFDVIFDEPKGRNAESSKILWKQLCQAIYQLCSLFKRLTNENFVDNFNIIQQKLIKI